MGFSSGTSTRWLYVHCFQVELEFGVLVFVEGGKPDNPEKNPRSRNENQQQTQPTCDARSGNRTRATAMGGERSHHCAIPNYKSETHVSKCLTNTSIVTRKIKIRRQNVWVCSANKNITYDSWLVSLLLMIRRSLRFGCSGLSTVKDKLICSLRMVNISYF